MVEVARSTVYSREWRRKHKLLGLCQHCCGEAIDGSVYCDKHREIHRNTMKRIKDVRKEKGICRNCDSDVVDGKICCLTHIKYYRNGAKERREQRANNRLCIACGRIGVEKGGQRCTACAEEMNRLNRMRTMKIRMEVIDKYGGVCVCCGENDTNFLQLDHTNNNGAEHRREIGLGRGSRICSWARRNDYPDILQVLCANCNFSKRMNGGVCSHTKSLRLVECQL